MTETWKAVCREEWYQMHIFRSLKEAEDFAKWHNRDTGHIVDVERESNTRRRIDGRRRDKEMISAIIQVTPSDFIKDHHGL